MSGNAYFPRLRTQASDGSGTHDEDLREELTRLVDAPEARLGAEALLCVLICARHVSEALEARATAAGISLSRLAVLLRLWRVPRHEAPMHELATACNVSARNITGLVDGLEAAGLVQRVVDPGDRRVSLIRLTDTGLERVEVHAPGHWDIMAGFAAGLSSDEQSTLIDLCVRLAAAAASTENAE